jgi:Nucleotidyl transferase/Phosphotransferase enzyme family
MHIVIVAGGLGSRLAPLTNHIPKFLVNIGKETGFVEQIRYWSNYRPASITVIVHSAYKDLVQAYYDLYFRDDKNLVAHLATQRADGEYDESFIPTPFIVKTVDEANGSAHAIMTTCKHLENKPVLFTWCDVLPGEHFDVELLNHGGVFAFTNYDHPNRYDLVQVGAAWSERVAQLREDGRGGIFGVYYLSTYKAVPFEAGQDFVEVLHYYGPWIKEIKINRIIDWGDKPKLERTRSTADHARSFNSVEIHGELVLKSSLNTQGDTLIKREIKWYDELSKQGSTVRRPRYWPRRDEKSFVMTKVKGIPIWELWPKLDDEGRTMVLTRIFEQLDLLHNQVMGVGNEVLIRDMKAEACDKLLARYREIKPVIDSFGEITVVNGHRLREQNPEVTINRLYAALHDIYAGSKMYSLIHGDLQMSNSMIDPDTLEVTLIDPRGYFGKTDTYGLEDYDYAKLYYSLSGYDLFNYSKEFHIDALAGGALEFVIPKPNLGGCLEIMNQRFWYQHQLWLAVIWIGLGQYIKSDPVKMLAAHYHGLAIAEQVLGEHFDRLNP